MTLYKIPLKLIVLILLIIPLTGCRSASGIGSFNRKVVWLEPQEEKKIKILRVVRDRTRRGIMKLDVINETDWEITGFDVEITEVDDYGYKSKPVYQYFSFEKEDNLGRHGIKKGKTVTVDVSVKEMKAGKGKLKFDIAHSRGFGPGGGPKKGQVKK